jgi:hypothetical protein
MSMAQREAAGDGLEVRYVYTRTATAAPASHRADQRPDPRLGRLAAGGVAGGVRVWPDRVRRGRRRPARARGPGAGRHQDRTLRAHRRQAMSDYMDGNMLGGTLGELFSMDVTSATVTCVSCGASWAIAQTRVYPHAPGMVARCPRLRRGAAAARPRPRPRLAGPARRHQPAAGHAGLVTARGPSLFPSVPHRDRPALDLRSPAVRHGAVRLRLTGLLAWGACGASAR